MYSILRNMLIKNKIRIENKIVILNFSQKVAMPLRSRKPKSSKTQVQHFLDMKNIKTIGGDGGNGCISFLRLWCNENAGPDGGDGGNGGHVVLQASNDIKDLAHLTVILKGEDGENGASKDCHGKNAHHNIVQVPIGTIIKNNIGKIVGDLDKDGLMFVAARGGAGGKGNHFFISDKEQAPQVSEYGAKGEHLSYELEIRSMAHIGLIGFPNAGKSTLLRAITRARPKVASYPFTTLKPHLGIIQYDDYQQIAVADLPGLIPGSAENRGLGIQFLKHAERCGVLLFMIDITSDEPWEHYKTLINEIEKFSKELAERPQIIVASKIDLLDDTNRSNILKSFIEEVNVPVIPISAKVGNNLSILLKEIKILYDQFYKIEQN